MSKHERGGENPSGALRAYCRTNMYAFLKQSFEIVCPGQKFQPALYLQAMCFALQEVAEGRETRLMISVAPRHLKSICASVILPAFMLGKDPTAKIMVISYGGDLARDLADTFRRLVRSDFYKELFPETQFDPKANRIELMRTTQGGSRMSLSLAGPMTGKGASLIILDDLTKAGEVHYATTREDVRTKFDQSIYSRLDNKKTGAIVSVAQRLHADDITAYLLEKDIFRHLVLESIAQAPATHALYGRRTYVRTVGDILNPEREPKEVLDKIREEMGDHAFSAQYLQDPRPGQSLFLTMNDLATVSELPPLECFTRWTQSWDTAAKDGPRSCFSVGLTFGWHETEKRWYLLDVCRERLDYTSLKDRVISLWRHWRADLVFIENSALGIPLLQELRKLARGTFRSVEATEGKLERFITQTDWLKAGNLVFPTSAPWFRDFRGELLNFPNDTYCDQVDALVQWIAKMRKIQGPYLDKDPETGIRNGLYRRNERPRRPT